MISGGTVGDFFDAFSGSEVTISAGTIGVGFSARDGSTVNLVGLSFFLDGENIDDRLTPDVPFVLDDRDVLLSGRLADGSVFDFELNTIDSFGQFDFFSPDATLTLRLIPEPTTAALTLLGVVGLVRRASRPQHRGA